MFNKQFFKLYGIALVVFLALDMAMEAAMT
jgi:hypothetical protein